MKCCTISESSLTACSTYDETEEVVDTFKQVYVSAEQLREIADELVSSIDYFKMQ